VTLEPVLRPVAVARTEAHACGMPEFEGGGERGRYRAPASLPFRPRRGAVPRRRGVVRMNRMPGTGRESPEPRSKRLFEMPLFAALLGAVLGGVIGFTSSWIVTQTQLHHTDQQNLVAARRADYEAFVRDMKMLSLTTGDLQSAVAADPQGSDAVNASATMDTEATTLVTDSIDVQIDGSTAARSLANSDFTIVHQALVNLIQNQADPAAYQRVKNALDQSIAGFIKLAREELGANTL
jgi:hypothetical protein